MVCRRARVLYVPTPKAACTSLKWLFANFEGNVVPPEETLCSLETRAMAIHSHETSRVDRLEEVDATTRNTVLTSSEWVRLGVTRDPCERILSAWVNRRLLVPDADSLSDVLALPESALEGRAAASIDIRDAFRGFVRSLEQPDSLLHTDPHFMPQATVIDIHRFPYTDVVDVRGLEGFLARLRSSSPHRAALGPLPRVNLSPSFPIRAMYDHETAEVVRRLHAADYERFGYSVLEPDSAQPPVLLSPNELIMIQELRERALRTRDLAMLGHRLRGLRAASRNLVAAVDRKVKYELRVRGYRGGR